jgi:PleD family two-component response regulator
MAMGTPPVDSLAELMARADLALYHSKAEGRDQLSVYADG